MPPTKRNLSVVETIASIQSDSIFFLVREFIAPYLDALVPCEENRFNNYVTKAQFFTMVRKTHVDDDEETKKKMGFLVASGESDGASGVNGGVTDLEYAEFAVWDAILKVSRTVKEALPDAEQKYASTIPINCVSFGTLHYIAVFLVDGEVTDKAQRTALKELLDQHFEETSRRIMYRNEFVVLLQSNQAKKEALRKLDFERIAFYLFSDEAMDIFILKTLIDMTHKAPSQHSFVTSYCERKMAQLADVIDLLWFIPFLAIYIVVVVSSKGLLPRSYTGYGIYKGFENTMNTIEFPECYRNDSNVINCDGAMMSMQDVGNAEQLYGFLRGHTSAIFWPSENVDTSAAETIVSNSLRPVGAVKIRQYRAPGLVDDTMPKGFFSAFPDNGTSVRRYPPYDPNEVSKAVITSMRDDPVIKQHVLMPWDGSQFATCDELNSTASVNGLNKDYSCDGHALIIPINATKTGYQRVIDRALANEWVDVSTRAVFVEYFLFHQSSGMFFTMTHIFEFQAGGAVTTMVDATPFNFHDRVTQSTGFDALYFIFIAYLAILILLLLLKLRKRKITPEQVKWLLLDLTNYALFVVSIIMRLVWMSYGSPDNESPVWQVEYFPNYSSVASQFTSFVTIDAFNAILSILAVFRYTKFVPGLDNVVNTLQRSLSHGITIAFFAFVLLFAFAICGCIVYGNMLGYQTVPTAAQSLIVIMWGDFEFRPLHAEQPTFTFFFFAAMNLTLIAILMSSIIAVFTDAFSDEKDSAFDASNINAILENNPHHTLERSTMRTVLLGFAPFQLVWAMFSRLWNVIRCNSNGISRKYSFDRYDENVAYALQCVLMSTALEDGEPTVTSRVVAVSELIALIEAHVRMPRWEPISVVRRDAVTSVYDYAELIFDSRIDFCLTMTLYVLIPQDKFNQSGVSLLISAARAQKRWAEKVEARTVSITDEEQLQLRVASVANTEGILGGHANLATEIASFDAGSAEALVSSMSLLNCRVFLGIIATAKEEHFADDVRLSSERFAAIAAEMEGYPIAALPPARLYSTLGVTDFEDRVLLECTKLGSKSPNFRQQQSDGGDNYADFNTTMTSLANGQGQMPLMKDFIPLLQSEYAYQCLSCHFSQLEACAFERECFKEFTDEKTDEQREADEDTGGRCREYKLSQEQFKRIYKRATGSTPSASLVNRIFSIFPDGLLSSSLFLTYCRGNPQAHHCISFQQSFARTMDRYSSFLAWAIFYVPFLIIILYFLLIGYNLGEVVHVSESLKNDFKPAESSAYTIEHIHDWLFSVVDEIYLADDGPAQMHNYANFYIGALRIRQQRVKSDSADLCRNIYNVYFGDVNFQSGDYSLNFPPTMQQSPDLKSFYKSRVARDFSELVGGKCYSAYDLGGLRSELDIPLPPTHTVSNDVLPAFKYKKVDGYSSNGHDTGYSAGGYMLDVSFQTHGTVVKDYLKQLKENNWIGSNTRFVAVEFASYNYNLQIYTYSQFGFEVTDGGVMHPIGKVLSSPQVPLNSTTFTVFTVFLVGMVIIYIILVILEIISMIRLSPSNFFDNVFVAILRTLWTNPWTLVDLYIIACFIASWLWRLTLIGRQELGSLVNNNEYPLSLENYCTYCDVVQKVEGTTLFLVFVRFLQILSFIPNVSLVFKTVVTAAGDLLSVLVLFVIALLGFALGNILLFGYFVDQSFNIQNAFFDLFSTSMGGPPSYPFFQPHRRNVALVFQIAFIIVCMFILYNMVVAVLTGALSKVKNGMFDDSEANEVRDQNQPKSLNNVNVLRAVRKSKRFLASLFLVRECVQLAVWVQSIGSDPDTTPISNQCRSQRALWSNFARWWSAVDSRTPREAVLSGLNILRLTQEVRDAKDAVYTLHQEDIKKASKSDVFALSTLNDHKEMVFEMEAFNDNVVNGDYDLLLSSLPAFHIYGRDRLPVWDEYLFSKLRGEFISMKRHMIMVPSFLLLEEEDSLWLQAMAAHHYFTAEREKYNVDCDGSVLLDMYEMLPDVNTVEIERGANGSPMSIGQHNNNNYARGGGGGGDASFGDFGSDQRIVRRLSISPSNPMHGHGHGATRMMASRSPQDGTFAANAAEGGGFDNGNELFRSGTFAKKAQQQSQQRTRQYQNIEVSPDGARRYSHPNATGGNSSPSMANPLNALQPQQQQQQQQGNTVITTTTATTRGDPFSAFIGGGVQHSFDADEPGREGQEGASSPQRFATFKDNTNNNSPTYNNPPKVPPVDIRKATAVALQQQQQQQAARKVSTVSASGDGPVEQKGTPRVDISSSLGGSGHDDEEPIVPKAGQRKSSTSLLGGAQTNSYPIPASPSGIKVNKEIHPSAVDGVE